MNKNKVFMIVSITALIIAIIGGAATYAWYIWNTSEEEQTKIVTNVGAATIYYDSGASITEKKIKPVEDKKNGIVKKINVKSNVTNDLRFNLYLDINNLDAGLHHSSFRFAFYEGDSLVKEGNFSNEYLVDPNIKSCDINGVNHIVLLENKEIKNKLSTYTLYIWIDAAEDNPESMQNQAFDFILHADGEDAIIREGKIPDITQTMEGSLAYNIVNQYSDSSKATITNNGVAYYYDKEHNLMSDIAGNVRYYGATPNNYIYFNCETYPETNCEKWRIIGVFEGKVKLIRYGSITNAAWDQEKNNGNGETTYNNDWSNSSLQQFLNGKYYDRGESKTYTHYTGNTGSSSVSINLENVGIKNDTTRELISDSIWYLNGWTTNEVYADQIYDYERNPRNNTSYQTTISRNIGIPYMSDYGYAVDFENCNKQLNNYSDATCKDNNWMKSVFKSNTWLLTHNFSSYQYIWFTNSNGGVQNTYVYLGVDVVPVLYLDSELGILSGDGSSGNPYRLSVN